MMGFIDSCSPLIKRILQSSHKTEIVLLSIGITTLIVTLTLYLTPNNTYPENDVRSNISVVQEKEPPPAQKKYIYVHISGGVHSPDVYKLPSGSRVYDCITQAGGLSESAATAFISRNINFARILSDQEKIYIPTYDDIQNGAIDEYVRVIHESFTPQPNASLDNNTTNGYININTSPLEELDSLPGVGPVTAQKIIDGRPYNTIDELIDKKILTDSVFKKIKQSITIYE